MLLRGRVYCLRPHAGVSKGRDLIFERKVVNDCVQFLIPPLEVQRCGGLASIARSA
jgi:hypothetical protein